MPRDAKVSAADTPMMPPPTMTTLVTDGNDSSDVTESTYGPMSHLFSQPDGAIGGADAQPLSPRQTQRHEHNSNPFRPSAWVHPQLEL
jgi:hypothetical protein